MTELTGVAILGGGRWAQVLASVLADVLPKDVGAFVASDGNAAGWAEWLLKHPYWVGIPNIAQALTIPNISHVIIARRAKDHADTALQAISAGKAVLVEKPFCLTLEDLDRLLKMSPSAIHGTGLVFHFATNQRRFQEACQAKGAAHSISLDWTDPKAEMRHGQVKSYDPSLNVLQDVLPHAFSVIQPLLSGQLRLSDVDISNGGRGVVITLAAGEAAVCIKMQRDGAKRERRLHVSGADWQAELDFATEPGSAQMNGSNIDVAQGFSSPLAAELKAFIENRLPSATQFTQAQEAIRLSIEALDHVRIRQVAAVLGNDAAAKEYALREIRNGGVRGDGIPVADAAIDAWLTTVT